VHNTTQRNYAKVVAWHIAGRSRCCPTHAPLKERTAGKVGFLRPVFTTIIENVKMRTKKETKKPRKKERKKEGKKGRG
jgi:hypothetical protein